MALKRRIERGFLMLVEISWRNKNIDDGFCTLKKIKKVISESYTPGAFGLNKAQHFVVSTEEDDKNTLELRIYFRCRCC